MYNQQNFQNQQKSPKKRKKLRKLTPEEKAKYNTELQEIDRILDKLESLLKK